MRIVTMDMNKCVGCRNCEYACALKKTNDFNRNDSMMRMNYYPLEVACIPMTCVHCNEAFCAEVCPAGAIKRNTQTGAVEIDEKRCVGCKMCIMACPFGNIHFDKVSKTSKKCDLCQGEPNCVKYCISGALQYVEEEEAYGEKRVSFDCRLKMLKRQDESKEAL